MQPHPKEGSISFLYAEHIMYGFMSHAVSGLSLEYTLAATLEVR